MKRIYCMITVLFAVFILADNSEKNQRVSHYSYSQRFISFSDSTTKYGRVSKFYDLQENKEIVVALPQIDGINVNYLDLSAFTLLYAEENLEKAVVHAYNVEKRDIKEQYLGLLNIQDQSLQELMPLSRDFIEIDQGAAYSPCGKYMVLFLSDYDAQYVLDYDPAKGIVHRLILIDIVNEKADLIYPGHTHKKETPGNISSVRWSPDSRYVIVHGPEPANQLHLLEVKSKKLTPVYDPENKIHKVYTWTGKMQWADDEHLIAFEEEKEINLFHVASGKRTLLATMEDLGFADQRIWEFYFCRTDPYIFSFQTKEDFRDTEGRGIRSTTHIFDSRTREDITDLYEEDITQSGYFVPGSRNIQKGTRERKHYLQRSFTQILPKEMTEQEFQSQVLWKRLWNGEKYAIVHVHDRLYRGLLIYERQEDGKGVLKDLLSGCAPEIYDPISSILVSPLVSLDGSMVYLWIMQGISLVDAKPERQEHLFVCVNVSSGEVELLDKIESNFFIDAQYLSPESRYLLYFARRYIGTDSITEVQLYDIEQKLTHELHSIPAATRHWLPDAVITWSEDGEKLKLRYQLKDGPVAEKEWKLEEFQKK